MPTLLDSLFFQIGWDTKDFDRGRKDIDRGFKGAGEQGKKFAGEIESAGKSATAAFRSLRNETVGLFLAFTGASSLKSFLGDMVTAAASTDRIAKNIGTTTEKLTAFQLALRENGGTAADATNALGILANQIQSNKLSIATGNEANLSRLGVTNKDVQNGDPMEMLLKIADASRTMSRPEFAKRAGLLGFSTETIDLLAKGRRAVEQATDAQRENAKRAADAAEVSQKFQKVWADIGITLESAVLPFLTQALNAINGLIGSINGGAGSGAIDPAFGLLVTMLYGMGKAAEYTAKAVLAAGNAIRWVRGLPPVTYDDVMSGISGGSGSSMELTDGAKEILRNGGTGGGAGPSGAGAPAGVSGLYSRLAAKYGKERADGIWRGIGAESGWNPNAFNKAGGGQGAYGLGQWRGARLARLRARYGNKPTAEQQLEFLMWELEGGDPGGSSVLNSKTSGQALSNYIGLSAGKNSFGFMRPDMAGRMGDLRRAGMRAPITPTNGGGGSGMVNVTIGKVETPNAETFVRDLPGTVRRRGLVVQSSNGLSQ